jgi:hypothetical protein
MYRTGNNASVAASNARQNIDINTSSGGNKKRKVMIIE